MMRLESCPMGLLALVSILNNRQSLQETLVDLLFFKLFAALLMEDGDADFQRISAQFVETKT